MQSGKRSITGALVSLFCVFAVLLTACGSSETPASSSTQKAAADQQIFISPISGRSDIKTFDPARAGDIPSISMIQMVFTGLVSFDNNLNVQDQLAASHKVSSDGTTYTFTLRDNLKFSDGTPLTSEDVALSIDRALQPATKSGVASSYLGLIKDADKLSDGKAKSIIGTGIQTPDDKTVVIKLSQPAAYFLFTLAYNTSYVIDPKMIKKYGDQFADHLSEGIGGAGPWVVEKYERGKEIVFKQNPNYYGKKPQLKKVVVPFYKQKDTTYQAYQSSQVHSAGIPSAQTDSAKSLSDKQYRKSPLLDVIFYSMNYLTKPFDNIKIRQAFALAINKDAIAQRIYKNDVIATNHVVPEGMPGYYKDLKGPAGVSTTKGDSDLAKKLFTEGLQESKLTLQNFPPVTMHVATKGSTDIRNELAVVQEAWKSTLGVDVKFADSDFSTLLDKIDDATNNAKGIQMWRADWYADYPDPQDYLTLLFDKGSSKNNMNYGQNPNPYAAKQVEIQNLMHTADANTNSTERLQQYNKVEQALIDDAAWIPIYQDTSTYVLKPCVTGVVDTAIGLTPPDAWADVYINTSSNCAKVDAYK